MAYQVRESGGSVIRVIRVSGVPGGVPGCGLPRAAEDRAAPSQEMIAHLPLFSHPDPKVRPVFTATATAAAAATARNTTPTLLAARADHRGR